MTFDGVPFETRKALPDGTTIFERVLPGADRMYPDTDSAPIPLHADYIDELSKNIPDAVADRYAQMVTWGVPQDCFNYIFTHNFFPRIKKIVTELEMCPKFVGTFFGHRLKHLHGQYGQIPFCTCRIFDLFAFLKQEGIDKAIAADMLKLMFEQPKADFSELLNLIGYKKMSKEEIMACLKNNASAFKPLRARTSAEDKKNSLLGSVRAQAIGNLPLTELAKEIINC